MIKKIWQSIKRFFIFIWNTFKGMKTVKGIISLLISFFIFYGWAIIFIWIGIVSENHWFTSIGTAVVIFWAGPFTPFIGIWIGTAFLIQKYILRDRTILNKHRREENNE